MSAVIFDDTKHEYTLKSNGKKLKGITGVIKKHLFPEMYANVPDVVLAKAAERGTAIHEEVELYCNGFQFAEPSEEGKAFICWAERNKVKFSHCEFLVTDGENFASAIDLIDAEGNLYDIKTTSTLHEDYVRWQLSIYAYFLELMGNDAPEHLYAIHLRGDVCNVVEVERIPSDIIKALLDAELNGDEFQNPLQSVSVAEGQLLSQYKAVELAIIDMEAELKQRKEQQAQMKNALLQIMQRRHIHRWETDALVLTVKEAYERKTVDSKRLQEELPDVYASYLKTSVVNESLGIKIK